MINSDKFRICNYINLCLGATLLGHYGYFVDILMPPLSDNLLTVCFITSRGA